MPFKTQNANVLRKIVDLTTTVNSSEDDLTHEIQTHLGIFKEEMDIDEITIEIGLKAAFLSVETSGLEIDPGSKFGEMTVPEHIETEAEIAEVVSREIALSDGTEAILEGGLSTLKGNLSGTVKKNASKNLKASVSLTKTQAMKSRSMPVEAVGDDRWKISRDGEVLHAKFLDGVSICTVTPRTGRPNRRSTTVSVVVRKRDLEARLVADRKLMRVRNLNRERMLSVFISRKLAGAASAGSDTFVMSTSESVDED